jgi:hypothetical protein
LCGTLETSMNKWICVIALTTAGCVTTSDVVPIGNDQYLLTGHASGGLNAGKGTSAAAEKAAAYCASQHKSLVVVNTELHGMAAVGGESTNFIFRCDPSQ